MVDWKNVIDQVAQSNATPGLLPNANNELLAVLDAFADGLDALDGVSAGLDKSRAAPDTYRLWLQPFLRPDERTPLLSFYSAPDGIIILSGGQRQINSADDLETYLLAYTEEQEFASSLRYLTNRSKEPYNAVLRQMLDRTTAGDVVVEVTRQHQEVLAQAARNDEELELDVTEVKDGPLAAYQAGVTYAAIYSHGFVLAVSSIRNGEPGTLHLVVTGDSARSKGGG